jgi:hypothetical protein
MTGDAVIIETDPAAAKSLERLRCLMEWRWLDLARLAIRLHGVVQSP